MATAPAKTIDADETEPSGYPLIEGNIRKSIQDEFGKKKPGVYVLRLRTEDLKGFQTMHKLLEDDPDGTLYIGSSADMAVRVDAIKKSFCSKYGILGYRATLGHSVSWMLSPRVMEKFRPERFWVDVIPVVHKRHKFVHLIAEKKLLMDYARQYGEFPFFNGMKLVGEGWKAKAVVIL